MTTSWIEAQIATRELYTKYPKAVLSTTEVFEQLKRGIDPELWLQAKGIAREMNALYPDSAPHSVQEQYESLKG